MLIGVYHSNNVKNVIDYISRKYNVKIIDSNVIIKDIYDEYVQNKEHQNENECNLFDNILREFYENILLQNFDVQELNNIIKNMTGTHNILIYNICHTPEIDFINGNGGIMIYEKDFSNIDNVIDDFILSKVGQLSL